MTVYLQDPDVTLHHGDALTVLQTLPAESVHCCVTSPPFFGLRDYQTGTWQGGDPGCDHSARTSLSQTKRVDGGHPAGSQSALNGWRGGICGKCGAKRVDQQIGLEDTPEQWVDNLVAVFREVRRVLRPDGTLWLEVGDSYAGAHGTSTITPDVWATDRRVERTGSNRFPAGYKPKDLILAPFELAKALRDDGWWLRSDIIWARPNPMPESVTDRPTKSHSYIFLLTKSPRYFFDQEAVREPYQPSPEHAWRYAYGRYNAGGGKQRGEGDGAPDFLNQTDGYMPPTLPERDRDIHQVAPGVEGRNPPPSLSESVGAGRGPDGRRNTTVQGQDGSVQHRDGERWPNPAGRNIRSVWTISTQPYPEAHFATFPEQLARRCIQAGTSEHGCCPECGTPWQRETESRLVKSPVHGAGSTVRGRSEGTDVNGWAGENYPRLNRETTTLGWRPSCECASSIERHPTTVPCVVLDPFVGSGTVPYVARLHGRHAIGIDLSRDYLELASRRLAQQSIFAHV